MKNIHLLPTENPSSLFKDDFGRLIYSINIDQEQNHFEPQNIYITNDEEIKEGDWVFDLDVRKVVKADNLKVTTSKKSQCWYYKKIILTTDQSLDGVQAIDDEFLQWFVKNPSCESVEVILDEVSYVVEDNIYKIIIPKEEPKQETLEEAKLRQLFKNRSNCYADTGRFENDGSYSEGEVIQAMDEDCFINVIKEWQAERMYSEEDLKRAFEAGHKKGFSGYPNTENWKELPFEKWFEQFKKK